MSPPAVWFDRAEYRRLSEPLPSAGEAQERLDAFSAGVRELRARLGLRDVAFMVGMTYLDGSGAEAEGMGGGHCGDNARMADLFAHGLASALRDKAALLEQHKHATMAEASEALREAEASVAAAEGGPPRRQPPEGPKVCPNCGAPATCYGVYEDPSHPVAYACDECCGHGNEDGWCEPVEASP